MNSLNMGSSFGDPSLRQVPEQAAMISSYFGVIALTQLLLDRGGNKQ